ncbi:Uncharacterized protein HSR122_2211 [Halapricum desulfuricans]|uniref:Uncharacterized protein n=1 Tax=Halapricum desulfuricans TaxID=2841257 RepID=A0A897NA20_9EURY|nr:Uncharacterized protein HSR122_2211 [Halapricum desulfuricans]
MPGATVVRQPIASSDHYVATDDATDRHPWQRAAVRTDRATRDYPSTDTDTDSETDTNSTPTDVGHDTAHDEPSGGSHR